MKTPHLINSLLAIILLVIACGKQNLLTQQPASPSQNPEGIVIGLPGKFLLWSKAPALPLPLTVMIGRKSPYTFAIGSKGYLGGGVLVKKDGVESPANDLWAYDTTTKSWSQRSDFLGDSRVGAASYALLGKGYVCTGDTWAGTSLKQNWQYDPTLNSWVRKKDFPGPARVNAVGNAMGGFGYVGTGRPNQSSDNAFADWYRYDPSTDTWTQRANVPRARWSGFSFASASRIFVSGGTDVIGNGGTITDMWSYEASGNNWIARTALPGARTDAVAVSLPQTGVVVSGLANGTTLSTAFRYSYSDNAWVQITSIPTARMDAGGFAIGGTVYAGGGQMTINAPKTALDDFWAMAVE